MQLIFIHGSGSTKNVWQYQTDYFKDSIAVSLPGHIEGECIGSIEQMAIWLKAYVDDNAITDLVLVGHSMGGGVALQYALDYPDDVMKLILVGSGGRLRCHPDTLTFMKNALDDSAPFATMIDALAQQLPKKFGQRLKADSMALGPAVFLNDFEACDRFDVMDRLNEIAISTLVIVGSEDVMTPVKYSEFLQANIENAKIKLIEGGSHYVFVDYPNEVNSAIDEFLVCNVDARK